jgi:hypothetical protein
LNAGRTILGSKSRQRGTPNDQAVEFLVGVTKWIASRKTAMGCAFGTGRSTHSGIRSRAERLKLLIAY